MAVQIAQTFHLNYQHFRETLCSVASNKQFCYGGAREHTVTCPLCKCKGEMENL